MNHNIPLKQGLQNHLVASLFALCALLFWISHAHALTDAEFANLHVFGNGRPGADSAELTNLRAKNNLGNRLIAGQQLTANDAIVSANGAFYATVNSKGSFSIYGINGELFWTAAPGTAVNGKVAMQTDGNLCLYPQGSQGQVWCSRSNRQGNQFFVLLRDTGVLEIYAGNPDNVMPDNLIWTSLLDTTYYNNRYADLNNAFHGNIDNLMFHWVTSGRYEARSPRAGIDDDVFKKIRDVHLDPIFYANKYADLKAAFGRDPAKLFGHWVTFGIKEGRIPNAGIDNFIKDAPRDVRGLHVMRVGDWLGNDTFMQSRNKQYVAVLMNDGPMEVFHASSLQGISNDNRVFSQQGRFGRGLGDRLPVAQRFMTMQPDGHFCTYEGSKQNPGKFVGCIPQGADDAAFPKGSYFVTLEDDGNLVIHRGPGPDDDRGYVWQSNAERMQRSKSWWEDAQDKIGDVAITIANGTVNASYQVSSWATGAANSVNNETVKAANKVAGVSTDAYNTVKDEALKFISDPLAWLRAMCPQLGAYLPSPFYGVDQAVRLAKFTNQVYPNKPAQEATACAEAFNVGFVCQVPEEIVDTVKNLASIPGLAMKAKNSAESPDCQKVASDINRLNQVFAPLQALHIPNPEWFRIYATEAQAACGVTLMLANDAVNVGKCTMAAADNGILQQMFDGEGGGTEVEKKCRLAGKISLKAAKVAMMKKVPASGAKTLVEMSGKAGMLNSLERIPACTENSFASVNLAWYGDENGVHVDTINGVKVADKVSQTMNASTANLGKISIPANMNQFFGGDPAPGKPKVLAVQLSADGSIINLRQKEGKALNYPGVEGVDYYLPKVVEIGLAWYGVEGQQSWDINGKKVADIVRAANTDGNLYIPANMNQFFGADPVPGKQKEVAVQVRYDGKVLNLHQNEGKALRFPGVEGVDYRSVK